METILALFAQHGLLGVFGLVLLTQLGAPLPGWPILLLAGAAAGGNPGFAIEALLAAIAGSLLADFVWFHAGRRFGRRVLALLCRISISPDSCVRKNELSFAQRGAATLVIAKFVPGLNTLAPPLAGALGMSAISFAIFTGAGAALWAGGGIACGFIFQGQIRGLLGLASEFGRVAVWLLLAVLMLYVAWRVWRRWSERRSHARIPRLRPDELAGMLERGMEPLIFDVRTPLEPGARIPGSRHLDMGTIATFSSASWPAGDPIVTYCDCPNDASATKAAALLGERGIAAHVLSGGIDAWLNAGYPVQAAGG